MQRTVGNDTLTFEYRPPIAGTHPSGVPSAHASQHRPINVIENYYLEELAEARVGGLKRLGDQLPLLRGILAVALARQRATQAGRAGIRSALAGVVTPAGAIHSSRNT